jgi:hypothetical protein
LCLRSGDIPPPSSRFGWKEIGVYGIEHPYEGCLLTCVAKRRHNE